ncbi:hypothetical protein ABIQ69_13010 [Agromyces sp. G08B096]|uniref:DUF3558 domain-containing protein n=1 Tax=Agromyces sp. G08B096 TaxID=3156399 RepID=A0AAU7W4L2_9MICO
MTSFRPAAAAIALVVAVALTGCASVGGAPASGPLPEPLPGGEVRGIGTVLQLEGERPELCLGPVAESAPPQCDGLPLEGWTWAPPDDLSTSMSGGTWGSYAVTGTWGGEVFTVTRDAVPLALFDPIAAEPGWWQSPESAGTAGEGDLDAISADLAAGAGDAYLGSTLENGHVVVTVRYDDGTVQAAVDERYGDGVVAVVSALVDAE